MVCSIFFYAAFILFLLWMTRRILDAGGESNVTRVLVVLVVILGMAYANVTGRVTDEGAREGAIIGLLLFGLVLLISFLVEKIRKK